MIPDYNWLLDLADADYINLWTERDNVSNYILENLNEFDSLDFTDSKNRSLILLLFDLSERLQLSTELEQIKYCIDEHNIELSSRLQAASMFNCDIQNVSEYIERFDCICNLLHKAIIQEEDNDKKALATFANYYLTVLDRNPIWILELRKIISDSKMKFTFLQGKFIELIMSESTEDITNCKNNIQRIKDNLFARHPFTVQHLSGKFLIEEGTDYASFIIGLKGNLTFNDIRKKAVNEVEYGSQLKNRGVEPLTTEQELYVYLKSFGNMHYAKMQDALKYLPYESMNLENIEIIDWGCGQGLATIVFLEEIAQRNINIQNISVTLIEPSIIALKRASLNIFCYGINNIRTVCKQLDNLTINDICTKDENTKIHLFSNILDVELFTLSNLEKLISDSQKKQNYFVCTSPYINDIKTQRILSLVEYFSQTSSQFILYKDIQTSKNSIDYWMCNNKYKNQICDYHPKSGCINQWTRVTEVFSSYIS